jgi:transcriptional regulator with XRE-family HTH domain
MASNRLKTIREQAGFERAKDLAKALGFSAGYVSELESGKRPLTEKVLRKLREVLKVSEGEILREDANDYSSPRIQHFKPKSPADNRTSFDQMIADRIHSAALGVKGNFAHEERIAALNDIIKDAQILLTRLTVVSSTPASEDSDVLSLAEESVERERRVRLQLPQAGVPSGKASPPKPAVEPPRSGRTSPQAGVPTAPKGGKV